MSKITLGNEVRCKITGFKGIATAKLEYINKCVQYCVKPQMRDDKKMPDGEYIDIDHLNVIGDGIVIKTKPTGGPQPDCPKN